MSDVMSFAEFAEQYVELLPARTVLSLWRTGTGGNAGTSGEAGTHGANGQSMPGTTIWALFLGNYDRSGSGSSYSYGIGDVSSKNS
jgi:hypothetical protein